MVAGRLFRATLSGSMDVSWPPILTLFQFCLTAQGLLRLRLTTYPASLSSKRCSLNTSNDRRNDVLAKDFTKALELVALANIRGFVRCCGETAADTDWRIAGIDARELGATTSVTPQSVICHLKGYVSVTCSWRSGSVECHLRIDASFHACILSGNGDNHE
jgi:hypothetical protein